MKKLITLTVAAMMVLPALAMANRAEDPCPGEMVVTPHMPMEHSKEKFHTVGYVRHHKTMRHHRMKRHTKHHSTKHKSSMKKDSAMKGDTAPKTDAAPPKAG